MEYVDLPHLLSLAKSGDVPAMTELLRRYEPEVRSMVRSRLPRTIRSRFDSMDFVQSIWTCVFTKESSPPVQFEGERHFLQYLSGIARNKVFEEHRRLTKVKKYNIALEEPLYVRRGNRELTRDVPGSDPSPSQDAQARDRLAQILQGRSEVERKIINLRRQGLTYDEIAAKTGMSEASIRRLVEQIRSRLEARGWR